MLTWGITNLQAAALGFHGVRTHVGTAALSCRVARSAAARSIAIRRISIHLALLVFFASSANATDCIPIHEARQHIGETSCVTGKVLHVKATASGVHFLDFCEDSLACPFTVVVFSHDLKDVGDVRRLAGRTIAIRGELKLYDDRPEIILSRIGQISGGATMIPPLPKNYDVENRGHYSAGHLRPSKKPAKVKATPNVTGTYGYDVEGDDPQ